MAQAFGREMLTWHHECEWTSEANAEAAFHLKQKICQKNPGHKNFIPIGQFNIDHLPPNYRDKDIVEWTKLTADLTLKVRVRYTSVDRPETFPNTEEGRRTPGYKDLVGKLYPFSKFRGTYSVTRTGTAFVWDVLRFIEAQCMCQANCPYTNCGRVKIQTARHVVYDDAEAEQAQLIFHYDNEWDQKIRECLVGKVECANTEADMCQMTFFSHDVAFLDWLKETLKRRNALWEKLYKKYIEPKHLGIRELNFRCESFLPSFPVIIVSHPHGCAKMVTVGECTQTQEGEGDLTTSYRAVYLYNTDTCPGSSGALACGVDPTRFGRSLAFVNHSASRRDGVNRSATDYC